jgi:MFS transporter, YQGE family, putative transporter
MRNKLITEYRFFLSMPGNMRILLMTNMVYAFVLPILEIFVGAYIMRSSNSPMTVVIYQLTVYTGIPVTFLINGFLFRKIKIARLYSIGMLLSGFSVFVMMTLDHISLAMVGIAGIIMGISYGFFWSNRDFLAINTTLDSNRNYYYGLETFFYTLTAIIVPFAVGLFLSHSDTLFAGKIKTGYRITAMVVFLLTLLSSLMIHKGSFSNPKLRRFIFFRYDKLWYKMLVLAGLKGLVQGYLVTAPAILVMRLVGDEHSLGIIQSISGIITALLLYILGRITKPSHRIYIFSAGYIIFFIGTLFNGLLFSSLGVMVFILCKVLFQPLHDIAYFPIQMKVINVLSGMEKRSEFAYIFNHEFGLYIGRFAGLGLFISLSLYVSETFALQYSLLIIAVIQILSIPLARHIIKKSKSEPGEKVIYEKQ